MIDVFILLSIVHAIDVQPIGDRGVLLSIAVDAMVDVTASYRDAVYVNAPGEPDLPSLCYKIGLPQNSDFTIHIREHVYEKRHDVDVDPVTQVGLPENALDVTVPRSSVYMKDEFFPGTVVEPRNQGYFRDIHTVEIIVHPVQYNPVTREMRLTKTISLEIEFHNKPRVRTISDRSFESLYEKTIVNFSQCKSWRREKITEWSNPFQGGAWFKIEVAEEGLYRIGYDEIVAVGLDPAQFDPRSLKIYTALFDLLPRDVTNPFDDSLVQVPVHVEGEDDNRFDRGDYLVFYAFPASHFLPDSHTSSESLIAWYDNGYVVSGVYWLTFGGENGLRMEPVDASWNGSTPTTTVRDVRHIELNKTNPSRSGTNWYWLDISPGEGQIGEGATIIHHPGATGSATVMLGLFNMPLRSFLYEFSFDNDLFFSETCSLPARMSWPPNYLTATAALSSDSSMLRMTLRRVPGTTGEFTVYFNGLDIEYDRRTEMTQDFHAYFRDPAEYTIECSETGNNPFILDITDMKKPKRLIGYEQNGGTVRFTVPTDSFQLLYFSKYELAEPVQLQSVNPGHLRIPSEGCDYLIITHRDFANALGPLVDHRSREYTVKVVIVDEVYDDFSYGKRDPLAIKHFLYHAYNNWSIVPTFVLLVGDGTYDFKNNLGKTNPPGFIPMYEWGTDLTGNPGIPHNPSYDGEYVNFGAGEVMVLGRITARTRQEVRDYTEKLILYETAPTDGMWAKTILLAGDDEFHNPNYWEGLDHCGPCEAIIPVIPPGFYDFSKVYMVSYPPFVYPCTKPNALAAFVREINKGFYAGLFFGHGNTHQLADEGLFFTSTIPYLRNKRRSFFFFFGSCTVGRFNDSDFECIAEEMVRIKEGAIGTMAATAGTTGGQNASIARDLFTVLTDSSVTMTIGECHLYAKRLYFGLHYLLIGDPAAQPRKVARQALVTVNPDSLRPMELLHVANETARFYIKAWVRDTTHFDSIHASTADKLSGHIFRLVQSGGNPPSFTPFDYKINGKELYHGYWSGDTALLRAPKIDTAYRKMIKVSTYSERLSGMRDSVRIFGTAIPSSDETGPEIALYDGGRRLKDNDWVDQEFTLTGEVSDPSGINLLNSVESSRGFYLSINSGERVDLRDYFMYDRNSITSGDFNTPLILVDSVNTIVITVNDNYFNQTIDTLILKADIHGRTKIEHLLVYPNPLRTGGGLWFTFTLHHSGIVGIKVFTVAGRLIKTIDDNLCQAGYNQIFWDVHDEYNDAISNGVYLVKAIVEDDNARDEIVEKFIIAR